jgi:hypothetical protein
MAAEELTRSATTTAGAPGAPDYRSDHAGMLVPISLGHADPAARGPDAIVVPTSRSPVGVEGTLLPGLRLASELATEFGCPLLVVCSREAVPQDVRRALTPSGGPGLEVVHLDEVDHRVHHQFQTTRHPLSRLWRNNDVGPKRNHGLLQAVARGWGAVLFLDDDVSPYAPEDLTDRCGTLDPGGVRVSRAALDADPLLQAVGWTLEGFDDNSVYGHARREAGQEQKIFVGAGALLVRVTEHTPFFPDIFNEDWLFLIALAAAAPDHRQAIGVAGKVHQRPYWPFSPKRARSEEAGDIIGEALLNLVEDHGARFVARALAKAYWRKAISSRSAALARTRQELTRAIGTSVADRQYWFAVNAALRAADGARERLTPDLVVGYLSGWLRDLAEWRSLLAEGAERRPGGAVVRSRPKEPLAARAVHVPNHRHLLVDLSGQRLATAERFDAVVVPTVRGAGHLGTAAEVARRAGETLVALCSGGSQPDRVFTRLQRECPGVNLVVVDVQDYRPSWGFLADGLALRFEHRKRDTATKRNLALLLARLMGWRDLLFIDDDVPAMPTKPLRRARAALDDGFTVAGWAFDDFPDHSALCHAYRSLAEPTFGEQVPFLGAGGMAVRVSDRTPHFPNIYNEDWFFLVDQLRAGTVGLVGELGQSPFDPFANPEHAALQEFGDLLAEGVMRLLPDHLDLAGSVDYWRTQLELRETLTGIALDQVRAEAPTGRRAAIGRSLAAADLARRRIRPAELVEWVDLWQHDQTSWNDLLVQLPAPGVTAEFATMRKALHGLSLEGRARTRAARTGQ